MIFKKAIIPMFAAAAFMVTSIGAGAQSMPAATPPGSGMGSASSMPASPMPAGSMGGSMKSGSMKSGSMKGSMGGTPDHGMPNGLMGGDGKDYTGAPDLQGAISLVTAGGAPGHFSLVAALKSLVGEETTEAEVAKLTKQYGAEKVESFVAVQNFAVNDGVKKALAAGVKFPKPMVHGKTLAVRVVKLGLVNGTYYEGVQLDHLITHAIHESVMDDIDTKFGTIADGNYHRIANQAHYDLAQALGAKTVKLAAYH